MAIVIALSVMGFIVSYAVNFLLNGLWIVQSDTFLAASFKVYIWVMWYCPIHKTSSSSLSLTQSRMPAPQTIFVSLLIVHDRSYVK